MERAPHLKSLNVRGIAQTDQRNEKTEVRTKKKRGNGTES